MNKPTLFIWRNTPTWLKGIAWILMTPTLYAQPGINATIRQTPVTQLLERTIQARNDYNASLIYLRNSGQNKPNHYVDLANVANLLNPTTYQRDQKKYAEAAIQALSNDINPLLIFDFSRLNDIRPNDQKIIIDNNRPYIGLLRLYTAIQSLGLDNLYTLYHQRLAPDSQKESPLARDKQRATYRVNDPEWKSQLKQVDAITLQRQMLELMADQLAETHQTRLTLERLLATSSVSLLQVNALLRTVIKEQENQVVAK